MSLCWFMRATPGRTPFFQHNFQSAKWSHSKTRSWNYLISVWLTRAHEFISPSLSIQVFALRPPRVSRLYLRAIGKNRFHTPHVERAFSEREIGAAEIYCGWLLRADSEVLFVVALQREFQRQLKQVYSSSCNWNPVLRYERHALQIAFLCEEMDE